MTESETTTAGGENTGSMSVGRKGGRVWRYLIVLLFVGAVVGAVVLVKKTRPVLIAGPMVQFPASDKLVVVWEMKAPLATTTVTLTDSHGQARATTLSQSVEAGRPGFMALCRPDSHRYEAVFDSLPSGEEYSYTIENRRLVVWRDAIAGPLAVRTPPPRGKSFRFIAFGDSGVGSNAQSALAEVMAAQKPDLIIHAGDLNQFAGAASDYSTIFFEPYAAMIRSIPLAPVLGNHDCATECGRPLLDFFVLPENGPEAKWTERNFYFDFGDARFVGLDANKPQEKQAGVITPAEMKEKVAPWLRGVLTNCDAKWKIVYYHQPMYTGGPHTPEGQAYFKEAFVGVLEECGVDLVFNGHNHLYERSAPIKGDQIVGEGQGVVYIVAGTGGARRYPMNLPPPAYNRVYNDEMLGFSCVDVTANRLELRQISDQGKVIDQYAIEKSSPAPLAAPQH